MCRKKLQVNTTFWDVSRIFTAKRKNLFQDSNFPNSHLPPIRGYSWHKNEIKRIRRCHYSSNNFQDSTKEKLLKENMGYTLRVLFFNAFLLGAESKNQLFSSEEASKTPDALCLSLLPLLLPLGKS
jgi:hypothetical protein